MNFVEISADRKLEMLRSMLEKIVDVKQLNNNEDFRTVCKEIAREYKVACFKAELPEFRPRKFVLYESGYREPGDDCVWYQCFTERTPVRIICTAEKDLFWEDDERDFLEAVCMMVGQAVIKLIYQRMSKDLFYFDSKTGLPNINYLVRFGENLSKERGLEGYTAMLINIKGTNYMNKKLGYQTVNGIIKGFAEFISDLLADDEVLARVSADIFLTLVKDYKVPTILSVISGCDVNYDRSDKSYTYNVQARAGLYPIDTTYVDFQNIFNSLSTAVNYARKVSHEDVIEYSEELDRKIIQMLEYAQIFKSELENGGFFVVYQPKVLITDNTVYGAEALVRWNHKGDVIQPSSFIGTLEREHLICALDWYVLENTCKDIKRWMDSGLEPVRISVNFSNDHLHESNVAKRVCRIADRYKVPREFIEIEITETVDNEEMDTLMEFVGELRADGFHVAIDDFGIGYSSLHLLNSVIVDVLKIDKAFVSKIENTVNKRERIILENIIKMAYELGIEVVAEGVETASQIEELRKMSCYRIQGFIFDKPLPEKDFTARLSDKKY